MTRATPPKSPFWGHGVVTLPLSMSQPREGRSGLIYPCGKAENLHVSEVVRGRARRRNTPPQSRSISPRMDRLTVVRPEPRSRPRSRPRRRPRRAPPPAAWSPPPSVRTPARATAAPLRQFDTWRGRRPLDDSTLAAYLAVLYDSGRSPERRRPGRRRRSRPRPRRTWRGRPLPLTPFARVPHHGQDRHGPDRTRHTTEPPRERSHEPPTTAEPSGDRPHERPPRPGPPRPRPNPSHDRATTRTVARAPHHGRAVRRRPHERPPRPGPSPGQAEPVTPPIWLKKGKSTGRRSRSTCTLRTTCTHYMYVDGVFQRRIR